MSYVVMILSSHPHTHFASSAYLHSVNDQLVHATLKSRPCAAEIRIWYPIDITDRRAIVTLENSHNHPTPRYVKPSYDGRTKYAVVAEQLGLNGLTMTKVDRGTI